MAETPHSQGPGSGLIQAGQRLLTTLTGIVETRVRLAVAELEAEKANLLQMILMVGLTLLFTAFGLMSLMVLLIWAVEPQYRMITMAITTGVLFALALILGIWVMVKARRSTLLKATRKELARDRQLLEDES